MSSEQKSLYGDFYFGLVNFLKITGCCKYRTNIAQISPTLHKKNPGPTLNKKKRLYIHTENVRELTLKKYFKILLISKSQYLKQQGSH